MEAPREDGLGLEFSKHRAGVFLVEEAKSASTKRGGKFSVRGKNRDKPGEEGSIPMICILRNVDFGVQKPSRSF